jgi:hypothetical protein
MPGTFVNVGYKRIKQIKKPHPCGIYCLVEKTDKQDK